MSITNPARLSTRLCSVGVALLTCVSCARPPGARSIVGAAPAVSSFVDTKTWAPASSVFLTTPATPTQILASSVVPSMPGSSTQSVVTEVIDKLPSGLFTFARLGPPSTSAAPGEWFYPTLKLPSDSPGARAFAEWMAYTAQGAIAMKLDPTAPFNSVSGSAFALDLPDGSTKSEDGGAGHPFYLPEQTAVSDDQISTTMQKKIATFGMTAQVKIYHPFSKADSSLEVTISVPNSEQLAGRVNDIANTVLGETENTYEGAYLEFSTPSGEVLSTLYEDGFAGVGGQWFEPGHDEYGMPHPSGPTYPSTAPTS